MLDLDALRHEGDPLLDPALTRGAPVGNDLVFAWSAALRRDGPLPAPLDAVRVPLWADPARLARAGRFFVRHAVPYSMLLGTASLLECFVCGQGARALAAARTMRTSPDRRVGETGQFVLELYGEGAWADGRALRTLLRVRVMHAAVRRRLVAAGWTGPANGGEVPLNQEDQLGTLFAFGLSPLLHLRALGVAVGREDVEDALHLWAVAGHVLGVRVGAFPRSEPEAAALAARILERHWEPTVEGRELTAALLGAYARVMGSPRANDAFLAMLRTLVGPGLCDALGVPRGASPRVGRALARGFGASSRLWSRATRVPLVGAATDALVPRALGRHARSMAGGRARFAPDTTEVPPVVRAPVAA